MLTDRIEARWIDAFVRVFELCQVAPGEAGAILSETQSRQSNVELAELALLRLGARPFHLRLATPPQSAPKAFRSTGASAALQSLGPAVGALAASGFVVDCTVEGLLHAPELPGILAGGARVLMVSNEHPDALERLVPGPALEPRVRIGMQMMKAARRMQVTSDAGTQLVVSLAGARDGSSWGYTTTPGTIAHWPGGFCLCFPAPASVNGLLVLAPGDVNLTFKRYLESRVSLLIQNDFVTDIDGSGLDAALMRSHFAAWGDREAYAVSQVGWGMNPAARWDSLAVYDKRDFNGSELRALAGGFLYSTGANEVAGRHAPVRFDLPMGGCTVALDDRIIVEDGRLNQALFTD